MSGPRIKICGMTNADDALCAVDLGADALGFIRYPNSPRCVAPEAIADILKVLPPLVVTVAVFVDAEAADIALTLEAMPLAVLQFHGQETEAECLRWGKPYMKTVRVDTPDDVHRAAAAYPSAAALLLDNMLPGQPGGTGKVFDWQQVPRVDRPLILAGGLDAANIAAAIRAVQPYGVDVCSGVETKPGFKDPALMRAFIESARYLEAT